MVIKIKSSFDAIKRMKYHRKMIKYYNSQVDYYTKLLPTSDVTPYLKYIRWLMLYAKKGMKILDVGCGNGIVIDYISKNGYHGYGIDVSDKAIKLCRRNRYGIFRKFDGIHVPFDENFFDITGLFNVLEHTLYPELLIREVVRVTKINGKIVIASPNFYRVMGLRYHHTRDSGVFNLMNNFFRSIKKYRYLLSEIVDINLEFMEPKLSYPHIPDIDAVYFSNPFDIVKILKSYGVEVIRYSSFELPASFILEWISKVPFVRYLTSTFILVGLKH